VGGTLWKKENAGGTVGLDGGKRSEIFLWEKKKGGERRGGGKKKPTIKRILREKELSDYSQKKKIL